MSIWEYKDRSKSVTEAAVCDTTCMFCRTTMQLLPTRVKENDSFNEDIATQVAACPLCGWWKLARVQQDIDPTIYWDPDPEDMFDDGAYRWSAKYYAMGSLKELDLTDLSQPVEEVKHYLLARYEKRFQVHPRLFEETVASVFRDRGYQARVTSYTGDGGIDVILEGPDQTSVGIQVKRYKNSITVEQIRSLAGALFVGGHTKGVFVTTSKFQSGCQNVANRTAARGMPIDLLDADRFFSELCIARRETYRFSDDEFAPFYDMDTLDLMDP